MVTRSPTLSGLEGGHRGRPSSLVRLGTGVRSERKVGILLGVRSEERDERVR